MYVIGLDKWNFLKIKLRTMMTLETCKTWNEIAKVYYECDLNTATVLPNYEDAESLLEKIKNIKNENIFENNNIIGQIIDTKNGNRIKVDELKIYELIPREIKIQ
ncbi:hypothetical protein [Eubacterium ventriosum]